MDRSRVTRLQRAKQELQRKRQKAVERKRPTMMYDKLISATQRRINELEAHA